MSRCERIGEEELQELIAIWELFESDNVSTRRLRNARSPRLPATPLPGALREEEDELIAIWELFELDNVSTRRLRNARSPLIRSTGWPRPGFVCSGKKRAREE
jgi:hypothetical protein